MKSFNNQALAELFIFIRDIAVAIRMNSAYSGSSIPSSPTRDEDVRWLSDALHNFDVFARCLANPDNASYRINILIENYEYYLVDAHFKKSKPSETFKRWDIDILHGIRIMKSILE